MLPYMSLQVKNISFKYPQGNSIFTDFTLKVGDGELVGLIGSSGCGKSTLLHCIAGILSVDAGDILINEQPVNSMKPHARGIGIMMQDQPLYEHLSVEQNIRFPLQNRDRKEEKVAEIIERLDLSSVADRKVSKCSGGERRRVALARAVIKKPKVLLLDEPFISVDPILGDTMKEYIMSLHSEIKPTTILVSHNHEEVASMCSTRYSMEELC